MTKQYSRREILGGMTTGLVLLTGCTGLSPKPLLTNTLEFAVGKTKQGRGVCTNEDYIAVQGQEFFDGRYFSIGINKKDEVLKYGEPSFAIIPEGEERITVTEVGISGGKVIVDAPEGSIYFPIPRYGDSNNQKDVKKLFEDVKPLRLETNFELKTPKIIEKKGKMGVVYLTNEDLLLSDDVLRTINGVTYIINKTEDFENDATTLPIYFTKVPFAVEFNRTSSSGMINIVGNTYVFVKGTELNSKDAMKRYIENRGLVEKIIKKQDVPKPNPVTPNASASDDQNIIKKYP